MTEQFQQPNGEEQPSDVLAKRHVIAAAVELIRHEENPDVRADLVQTMQSGLGPDLLALTPHVNIDEKVRIGTKTQRTREQVLLDSKLPPQVRKRMLRPLLRKTDSEL